MIEELLRADLEVSIPIRDRGIDLIAYADLDSQVKSFVGCPIQMKAASSASFSLNTKYLRFPNLILAYVWYLNDSSRTVTFAMTYSEALEIAKTKILKKTDWTTTPSWKRDGYTTTAPSKTIRDLLEPYRMTSEKWWKKVTSLEQAI